MHAVWGTHDRFGNFGSCRLIRESMMETLLASLSGPEVVHQVSGKSPNNSKADRTQGGLGGKREWSGGDAASACALWCTIAMGGLVQGQPPEQVGSGSCVLWTDRRLFVVCIAAVRQGERPFPREDAARITLVGRKAGRCALSTEYWRRLSC